MSILQMRPDVVVAMADNIVKPEHPLRLAMNDDGIAYAQAIHELVHRHGLDPDTVVAISQAAAGGPQEALALLDQGMPVEYVLAMGGTS